ncbi:MAG TPA: phosphoribosyltransferase [Anaeromyxobacter sp.]
MTRYTDRHHAGRVLADALASRYAGPDLAILALPRGGVPVGFEVAMRLGAPLDVFVVRKLGMPGQEELAIGAVASGGVRVVNESLVAALRIPKSTIEAIAAIEERELARRERVYRAGRPPLDVSDRIAILVDDGLATGSTMRAAVAGLRQRQPRRVVVGVPIAAPSTCEELAREVDDIVCTITPEPFLAVGQWYEHFSQTTDAEVRELLEQAAREQAARRAGSQIGPSPG